MLRFIFAIRKYSERRNEAQGERRDGCTRCTGCRGARVHGVHGCTGSKVRDGRRGRGRMLPWTLTEPMPQPSSDAVPTTPAPPGSDPLLPGAQATQATPGVSVAGTALRRVAAAFTYRDFRVLWLGACTSSIGTWMQKVAQNWLVLTLTDSAFFLGLDAFLGEAADPALHADRRRRGRPPGSPARAARVAVRADVRRVRAGARSWLLRRS